MFYFNKSMLGFLKFFNQLTLYSNKLSDYLSRYPLYLQTAHSNKLSNYLSRYPLYLQTAHSNAGFNVCDYNLLHNYFLHMFENSEDNLPQ